jgi:hypothetical protein
MTIQLFALLVLSRIGSPPSYSCHAFSRHISFRSILSPTAAKSTVERPSCVLSAVVEAIVEEEVLSISDDERGGEAASSSPISATKRYGINSRGAKMNEVCSVHSRYIFDPYRKYLIIISIISRFTD